MFERLLPKQIDQTYQGRKAALWLFAALIFLKTFMSLNSIFNGYDEAINADGLPLDAYTPACARTVVAMFAAWGLAQLILCLLCALALIRYRAMVPLMFALLLLEHLLRRLVFVSLPIVRVGRPVALYVNLGLIVLIAVGLALSLWGRDTRRNIS